MFWRTVFLFSSVGLVTHCVGVQNLDWLLQAQNKPANKEIIGPH